MVPLTAVALTGYDVFLLSATRYSIGSATLCLIILLARQRMPPLRVLPWRRIIACGIAAGAFVTLATISILLSDPITISALFAAGPLVAALISRMDQHTRLSRPVMIGLVAAVSGGVLVALGQPGDLDLRGGEILIIVAMAVWTWYSMKTQQWLAPVGLTQLQITAITLVCATALLWLAYGAALALGIVALPAAWPRPIETGAMLWLSFGPTATAIALWNFANAKVGVTVATLTINLTPIFSVLIAVAFGYEPTMLQIVGGAVVLAGVVWMQFAMMRAPRIAT
jgi:drug/metabolite transporter (DMT)-like permease